jgi:ribosome biogenesis GTPase
MAENGQYLSCRIKGKFRLDDIKHTNPVTVGDDIDFEPEADTQNGIITAIHPRTNYIIRKASNLSKQTHILASNIDQAMLVVTLVSPPTSLGFIDRFLTTAEAYHIPSVLVFNKYDLYGKDMQEILNDTMALYTHIGYTCIATSTVSGYGMEEVRTRIKNKITFFCGHSGAGKSSLMNYIEPNLQLKTAAISSYSDKGQHTTTFAEMHALSSGGFIIDTPGIRELGIVDIPPEEISHYFIEMQPYIGTCRFNNCRHTNEPGCTVKEALQNGNIDERRYESYLSILNNHDIFE